MGNNIFCEAPDSAIRVVRFIRPDVRPALYDAEAISETSLYKELNDGALQGLPKGGSVVLNFGLIDWFPTAFYRILLQAHADAKAGGGRIVLCCLTEHVREGFELMGGPKLFEVFSSETRAVACLK
jgi:anti-anti-sigma regulatory factor